MNMDKRFVPKPLQDFFAEHRCMALAFSGGCDSAYLLYAALCCGVELDAYYVHSQFQPEFERRDALHLAQLLGGRLHKLELDILACMEVKQNPKERCYFCKRQIFGRILEAASADGHSWLMDGTNASDDAQDRPGMRALSELQVLSPLRICGVTKAQVRTLSREAGLLTWNKPSYACLATRIPCGMEIRDEALRAVERSEEALKALGFAEFRVRATESGARLEVTEDQLPLVLQQREEILALLGADYKEITLDLRPRRERET